MVEIGKRYLMQVAAHNLGVILRKLFGVGTPRGMQGISEGLQGCFGAVLAVLAWFWPANVANGGFRGRNPEPRAAVA